MASTSITVSVPHDGVESALRFAAREALVRGCPLRVVHAAGTHPAEQVGDLLRDSVRVAELLTGPGVVVSAHPAAGRDVEGVLAASPSAELVVVHRCDVLRLVQSLSHGAIGSRAQVAVACVPTDWRPEIDDDRPVLVAVDDPTDATAVTSVVVAGIEAARRLGTWLRLVHVWRLRDHPVADPDDTLARLWSTQLEIALSAHVAEVPTYDVRVEIEVQRGVATDVLLDACSSAQVVLLGRNAAGPDGVCHLGRTPRTLLRASRCPVVLLPDATRVASGPRETARRLATR